MKNAPNFKYLPDDIQTEAIIFAGADAWIHAKDYQDNNVYDKVPPVVLAGKQLSELEGIRIIDDGRQFARVYRAGKIAEDALTIIATKLALCGVKEARLYSESHEFLEDWTPQLSRLRDEAKTGTSVISSGIRLHDDINLLQMADNEKALMLAERFEGIAIHGESESIYQYSSGVWEKVTPLELSRVMVAIYNEHQTNFSKRAVNNVIEALKIVIPVMGRPSSNLIPFANGVYDMETGEFREHTPDNWLINHNGVEYTHKR